MIEFGKMRKKIKKKHFCAPSQKAETGPPFPIFILLVHYAIMNPPT